MLKISGVYLIGNPEICQDPPSCGQDDQTLLLGNTVKSRFKKVHFPFLNRELFDLRKIYVVNLKNGRSSEKMLYVAT